MTLTTDPTPMIVGGRPWEKPTDSVLSVRYPADGQTWVGSCGQLDPSHLSTVLEAAQSGFAQHRRTTPTQRAQMLKTLAQRLQEHTEPLARLITLETGKPITMARAEVNRAITVCQGYGEVLAWQRENTYYIEGREAWVRHVPLGPVLAITPYNFPLNLVIHKLAPAMAAGNSFTLKPAPQTPLTALYLGRLAVESGYQALSVVPCTNAVAETLVQSDVFQKLSFTGSGPVGWRLKAMAGKKTVTLELGGNAGCIVESVPDPNDLTTVATRCAQGAFWLSGQSCVSVQRLFIKNTLFDPFLEALTAATRAMKVGDPLSEDTDIGAMISPQDVTRSLALVQEAQAQGATVVLGGEALSPSVMTPTLLTHTTPAMAVNAQECFAPIVTVTPYDTFEEALAWVNDSPFGLQAGVFTTDRNQAMAAYEHLEVGGVIINDVPTFRLDYLPYGGVKDSGLGREGVLTGIAEMSSIKTCILKNASI